MPDSRDLLQSLKKTYNQIGASFSASRSYIWPDLQPFLSQVKTNTSILDVGCGNGRLLLGLPEKIKYTGLDFSTVLLEKAAVNHPHAHFIETDITKPAVWKHLPQFDYIFCLAVLHHLPSRQDQLFVLKQIKLHLKPKGQCLITAWNLWQPKLLKHHFSAQSLKLKYQMKNLRCLFIPFQGKPRFHFAFTQSYLKHLLSEAGLKLTVSQTPQNYLLSNLPH